MAMFHTDVLDNQIKALPTIATASGAVANFTTDKAENLVECEVKIVAVQSGSGTPSPTNPRSISGFSACNLSHSGADTSNPSVYNIPFGQTIYGGVLNVGTGVLRVTHGYVDLGSLSWTTFAGGSLKMIYMSFSDCPTPPDNLTRANLICSHIPTKSRSEIRYVEPYNDGIGIDVSGNLFVAYPSGTWSDLASAKSGLSGWYMCYELATPQTIQLDSTTIQTIANSENNIWSDTGDVEVKFVLSVGEYVNQNV